MKERIEVLEKIEERIESANKDGSGIESLSRDIEKLANGDKSSLQKEIEALSDEIRKIEKIDKNVALEKAKEFINKHTAEKEIFHKIEDILEKWNSMSEKEIRNELKDLSNLIVRTVESLLEKARTIEKLPIPTISDSIGREINGLFSEKEKLLINKNEFQETLILIWMNSIVDFIKTNLFEAIRTKSKKEDYWKNALNKIKNSEFKKSKDLDKFNKELNNVLNKEDYTNAVIFGRQRIISYIYEIISILERGAYSDKLKEVIRLNKKEEMRSRLKLISDQLNTVSKIIGDVINLAEKGDFNQIIKMAEKNDFGTGPTGRILVSVIRKNANKNKKDLLNQLIKELQILNQSRSILNEINQAYKKNDYKKIDELCRRIIIHIALLNKQNSALIEIRKMKIKKNERDGKNIRNKKIAEIFSSLLVSTYLKEREINVQK